MPPILLRNYSMYDLIPLIEEWFENKGFQVSTLANRIEGIKKTGLFSSEKVVVFLEDYPDYCSVKIQGSVDVSASLRNYLRSLPPKGFIPCSYCGTLISLTERKCPNCGAQIKG